VDITHGEMAERAERQLDILIERRARQKDPDEENELWRESVRAYEEKRRQMARLEWHAFHCSQAERHRATLRALILISAQTSKPRILVALCNRG
jgi:hypothetical protein